MPRKLERQQKRPIFLVIFSFKEVDERIDETYDNIRRWDLCFYFFQDFLGWWHIGYTSENRWLS